MSLSLAATYVEPLESSGLLSRSHAMKVVTELAQRLARVDSTVLISGESGTGKERIARFLHHASERASGPFIAINCGALTETLLESELFGHARGAFTGAATDRPGLFEAADGGTLLLDEVGEVSAAMQVKLLRALQAREIRRVGENRSRPFDARILAATNRDLGQAVADGTFRQDLYYRLKVVELRVPALRERPEDVIPLARLLLSTAAARMKRTTSGFSEAVAERLMRHDWPGNVRELESAMERGAALARGSQVELTDLPEELRGAATRSPSAARAPTRPLAQVERDHIIAALELNGGNQTLTAQLLEIGTATLYRKLKSYGMINRPRAAALVADRLTLLSGSGGASA